MFSIFFSNSLQEGGWSICECRRDGWIAFTLHWDPITMRPQLPLEQDNVQIRSIFTLVFSMCMWTTFEYRSHVNAKCKRSLKRLSCPWREKYTGSCLFKDHGKRKRKGRVSCGSEEQRTGNGAVLENDVDKCREFLGKCERKQITHVQF